MTDLIGTTYANSEDQSNYFFCGGKKTEAVVEWFKHTKLLHSHQLFKSVCETCMLKAWIMIIIITIFEKLESLPTEKYYAAIDNVLKWPKVMKNSFLSTSQLWFCRFDDDDDFYSPYSCRNIPSSRVIWALRGVRGYGLGRQTSCKMTFCNLWKTAIVITQVKKVFTLLPNNTYRAIIIESTQLLGPKSTNVVKTIYFEPSEKMNERWSSP